MALSGINPHIHLMRKQGGGFGMVMLVVVLAIVLLLVAKHWQKVGPTALEIKEDGGVPLPVDFDDHGEAGAAGEVRSGNLPGLKEMRTNTGAYSNRLQEALEESNQ